jgi:heme/copper-type cytochrome/quinol oxidase subunit 2
MRGQYHVQTKEEFEKWLAAQTPLASSISG